MDLRKPKTIMFLLLLCFSLLPLIVIVPPVKGAWLSGWDNRKKIIIEKDDIDADLTHFPLPIFISGSCGELSQDMTAIFDEVGSNSLKIAVTKDDGTTQLYVEVEKWDSSGEEAVLWVSKSDWTIDDTTDTELYLYYDNDHADNTAYVGVPGSTPGENVWKSGFSLVDHLQDDPDTSHTRDSTSNDNDGTKAGANEPVEATGKIGEAQDFGGTDDDIEITHSSELVPTSNLTISAWVNVDASKANDYMVGKYGGAGNRSFGFKMDYQKVQCFISSSSSLKWSKGQTTCTAGSWFHVAMVWDTGIDVIKLYVNGAEESYDQQDACTSMDSSTNSLFLGQLEYSSLFLEGVMDEVRLLNGSSSVSWLKAEYESGRDHLAHFEGDLPGWDHRKKIIIDADQIDSDLTHFPVPIFISSSCGQLSQDLTCVFDEIGDNYLKMAVTKEDGTTQLYVEVEDWDLSNEEGVLWVSKSDWVIDSSTDTVIYLYYDNSHADNTAYVGDPGDTPAESVWDSNYVVVDHLQDGANTSHTYDSTSNSYDGTKRGAGDPAEATGKIGDAQNFDGVSTGIDYQDHADVDNTTSATLEAWAKSNDVTTSQFIINKGTVDGSVEAGNEGYDIRIVASTFRLQCQDADESPLKSTGAIQNDTWYYVTAIIDRTADEGRIFLDGSEVGSGVSIATLGNLSSSEDLRVGCYSDNWGYFPMDGWIDEVRISLTVRTDAWIKASYEGGTDDILSLEGWLSGWGYRKKITIDADQLTADLTWFPLPIFISSSCGQNSQDLTDIFDEVGSNSLKIAVTKSDGTTQLYVEVEKWNSTIEEAVLWTSRTGWTISSITDTVIYLYYDNSHADNTAYVGTVGSTPAQDVWDIYYKAVYHLEGSYDGTADEVKDSTDNNNDGYGNGGATGVPDQISAQVGYGQNFTNANNDRIIVPHDNSLFTETHMTLEMWFSMDAGYDDRLCYKYGAPDNYGFSIYGTTEGHLRYCLWGTQTKTPTGTATVDDGVLRYVVMQYHTGSNTLDAYVDLVSDITQESMEAGNFSNTAPLYIGNDEGANSWDGKIDEFRLSISARGAHTRKANYEAMTDDLLTFTFELTVGTHQGPTTMYAQKYDWVNATASNVDGHGAFVNVTAQLNGSVQLRWRNPGVTAYDTSGNSKDFENVDHTGAGLASGYGSGTSVDFDAIPGDFLNATDPISTLNDFSVSFWAKPDALTGPESGNQHFLRRGTGWYLRMAGDEIRTLIWTTGTHAIFESGNANLDTTSWHHITIVFNRTSLTTKIYLNGTETNYAVSQAGTGTPNDAGGGVLYMGRAETPDWLNGEGFDGKIDEVRMYDAMLTPSEVTSLYGGTRVTTDLVGEWLFEGLDEFSDASGYCTLDEQNSFTTVVNSSAVKMQWKVRMAWTYSEGSIFMNTTAYNGNTSATGSASSVFTFENDIEVDSATHDPPEPEADHLFTISGTIHFSGTDVCPEDASGITVKLKSKGFVIATDTTVTDNTGAYSFSHDEPEAGTYPYVIYALNPQNEVSTLNQTERIIVTKGSGGPGGIISPPTTPTEPPEAPENQTEGWEVVLAPLPTIKIEPVWVGGILVVAVILASAYVKKPTLKATSKRWKGQKKKKKKKWKKERSFS